MISKNPNNIWPPSHYYKRFSKEFHTQIMKAKKTTRGQGISSNRRRKE
jgi:hypothetical protein